MQNLDSASETAHHSLARLAGIRHQLLMENYKLSKEARKLSDKNHQIVERQVVGLLSAIQSEISPLV